MEQESKDIKEIKDTLHEHSKILIKLDHTICGDERASVDGFGKRIKNLEVYQDSDKKRWATITGIYLSITAFIYWIFNK